MKRFMLVVLACAAFSTAQAADPSAPVNEIMQEAVKGWAEGSAGGRGLFFACTAWPHLQ